MLSRIPPIMLSVMAVMMSVSTGATIITGKHVHRINSRAQMTAGHHNFEIGQADPSLSRGPLAVLKDTETSIRVALESSAASDQLATDNPTEEGGGEMAMLSGSAGNPLSGVSPLFTQTDCSHILQLISPVDLHKLYRNGSLLAPKDFVVTGAVIRPAVSAPGDLFLATAKQSGVTESWSCPDGYPRLTSMAVNGQMITTVFGGDPVILDLSISAPAPAGGISVAVRFNNAVASVGPVVIPAGATSGSFTITTTAVTTSVYVVVIIDYPNQYAQLGINVNPTPITEVRFTESNLLKYAASKVTLNTDDPSTWSAQRNACAAITVGQSGQGGAIYGSFIPWAPGSAWTHNIASDPVDPNSATWMSTMDGGNGISLRGPISTTTSDGWGTVHYGIPLTVVDSTTKKIPVRQDLSSQPAIAALDASSYPETSDVGPIPVPIPPAIQETAGPGAAVNYMLVGDKHLFVIDRDTCFQYETWNTYWYNGEVYAGTLAIFDLLGTDLQRPYGWTSTSVSGVPQYAGLVTVDEVQSGKINHALAFTAFYQWGRAAFTAPASSHQWNDDKPAMPPFGARMRLRKDFDITPYGPQAQVVLQALKDYGTIYVDGGMYGDMYWSTDSRWSWTDFLDYWHIPILGNMEFLKTGPIYSYRDALPPTGPAPAINTLEVYPTAIKAGSPAIVFWSTNGEDMRFLSGVGPTRKNFAIVYPTVTTSYTLAAQNKFGRTTRTVTLSVRP